MFLIYKFIVFIPYSENRMDRAKLGLISESIVHSFLYKMFVEHLLDSRDHSLYILVSVVTSNSLSNAKVSLHVHRLLMYNHKA